MAGLSLGEGNSYCITILTMTPPCFATTMRDDSSAFVGWSTAVLHKSVEKWRSHTACLWCAASLRMTAILREQITNRTMMIIIYQ